MKDCIIINEKTKLKGTWLYYCYADCHDNYNMTGVSKFLVRKLFVRTEREYCSFTYGMMRSIICKDFVFDIPQEQLKKNDTTFVLLKTGLYQRRVGVISTSKKDILDYMKYFLYNDTNANPWGYGGYGSYIELVKKRYREALEVLKKL